MDKEETITDQDFEATIAKVMASVCLLYLLLVHMELGLTYYGHAKQSTFSPKPNMWPRCVRDANKIKSAMPGARMLPCHHVLKHNFPTGLETMVVLGYVGKGDREV
jgi:hypothetical protein